jgi:hypothetical protein
MSLIIGVDSFVSLEDANVYWTNYAGGTNWAAAADTAKEQAIREATQYIDKRFKWKGNHPGTATQLLSWPRMNVVDANGLPRATDEVPQEVKDATAFLAEHALSERLLVNKDRGGAIRSVKAGSVQVDYESGAPSQKSYPMVDMLLSGLAYGGRNNKKILKS